MSAPIHRALRLRPDRWLVCSDAVGRSIRGPWLAKAEADSLAVLRARAGQLEDVTASGLADRVRALAAGDCGTVHIVVERRGPEYAALRRELLSAPCPVRLYGWQGSPLAVMASLNSPEHEIASAWAERRRMPDDFVLEGAWPEGWRAGYVAALGRWAETFRRDRPWDFAMLFDDVPVVSTFREVLAAIGAPASRPQDAPRAGATGPSSRVVRAIARPQSPVGEPTDAVLVPPPPERDADGSSRGPLRTWRAGPDLAVMLMPADADGLFELRLRVAATLRNVGPIDEVRVVVGSSTIDLHLDTVPTGWVDDGQGGVVASVRIPDDAEPDGLLADDEVDLELGFLARTDTVVPVDGAEGRAHTARLPDAPATQVADPRSGLLRSALLSGPRSVRGAFDGSAPAANDWSCSVHRVTALTATTKPDPYSAMRRLPEVEPVPDERWSLSRYPILGERSVLLMFEAGPEATAHFVGCRIEVVAEGSLYDLGEVRSDGQAELRMTGTVDISRADVLIWRRARDGD